jgi:DNA-binding HxlR family transcriptional regulator
LGKMGMGEKAAMGYEECERDARSFYCPVVATMNLLNEKWTLHILRELMCGRRRFNELSHRIGGVNSRTLRDRLRSLEEEGIVVRHVIHTIPPWTEYELTEKGRDLNAVLRSIAEWGWKWMTERVQECEGAVDQGDGCCEGS